jgi:hypothetical protein
MLRLLSVRNLERVWLLLSRAANFGLVDSLEIEKFARYCQRNGSCNTRTAYDDLVDVKPS